MLVWKHEFSYSFKLVSLMVPEITFYISVLTLHGTISLLDLKVVTTVISFTINEAREYITNLLEWYTCLVHKHQEKSFFKKIIKRQWPFKGQEVSLYLCHSSLVSCDPLPYVTYFLPKPVKSREMSFMVLILWQNVVQYWWTATLQHFQ